MALWIVRIMAVAAAFFLIMLWLFAATYRTPEERREDDEAQMEWLRELERKKGEKDEQG